MSASCRADKLVELRLLFGGERHRLRVDAAKALGVAVRVLGVDRDPFPALPHHLLGGRLELLEDQAVEELAVGEVAAVILDEEVAKDRAAGGLVGLGADEPDTPVGRAHVALGQELADHLRALVPRELLPRFLLPPMVIGQREGHELVKRELAVAVARHEVGAHRRELETLPHNSRGDAETCGDLLGTEATLVVELLEGFELVRGVHVGADHVLGQADLRGVAVGFHEARDRLGLLDELPLREELERLAAALAGGDEVAAGLSAVAVDLGLDHERLEQAVCRDARGELLEPDVGSGLADIRRRGSELVQGDVPAFDRLACMVVSSCTAPTPTHSALADAEETEIDFEEGGAAHLSEVGIDAPRLAAPGQRPLAKSFEKELFGYRVGLRPIRQSDHAHEETRGKSGQQLLGRCAAGPVPSSRSVNIRTPGARRSVSCSRRAFAP